MLNLKGSIRAFKKFGEQLFFNRKHQKPATIFWTPNPILRLASFHVQYSNYPGLAEHFRFSVHPRAFYLPVLGQINHYRGAVSRYRIRVRGVEVKDFLKYVIIATPLTALVHRYATAACDIIPYFL